MKIKAFMFILVFFTSIFSQTTYYFSASGSDANNGLTPSTAKQTLSVLQALLNAAQPGDQFLLKRGDTWITRAGTYGIGINNVSGTAGNYITIGTYGTGNKPILDLSGNATAIRFLDGTTNHYVKISNLEITSTAAANNRPYVGIYDYSSDTYQILIDSCTINGIAQGIIINSSGYWTISNSTFKNTFGNFYGNGGQFEGGEGVATNDAWNVLITNCIFEDNICTDSKTHFVYFSNSSDNCTVENSVFHDSKQAIALVDGDNHKVIGNTIYNITSSSAITVSSRPQTGDSHLSNVLIEKNEIYNSEIGIILNKTTTTFGDTGMTWTSDVRIINNLIYDISGAGWSYGVLIESNQNSQNLVLDDILFANNTVVNCYGGGVSFGSSNISYSNFSVKNNIFYNDTYSSGTLIFVKDVSDLSQITLNNNLYYSVVGSDINVEGINLSLSQFKLAHITEEINSISENPLFANPSVFDFHINGNSPAIDKGAVLTNVTDDFDGNQRPAGGGFDIGAYEFGATSGFFSPALNLKLFLEGPYSNGSMLLAMSEFLPLSQPYNTQPWNYSGNETVSSIPSGVVDWVLLEIRNNTSASTLIGKRAAFLRNDGLIVDLDGSSQVTFNGMPVGDYYVVINHRNHLSVMSKDPVPISSASSLYDFSGGSDKAFGTEPMVNLGGGKWGLYAGDGDRNGIINVLDYGEVVNFLFDTGYEYGDLDLNGIINVLDYSKTNSNLFKSTEVPN